MAQTQGSIVMWWHKRTARLQCDGTNTGLDYSVMAQTKGSIAIWWHKHRARLQYEGTNTELDYNVMAQTQGSITIWWHKHRARLQCDGTSSEDNCFLYRQKERVHILLRHMWEVNISPRRRGFSLHWVTTNWLIHCSALFPSHSPSSRRLVQSHFFQIFGVGWDWVHLVRRPLFGLLYQPRMMDDGECEVIF
jgi:hypothetical protein